MSNTFNPLSKFRIDQNRLSFRVIHHKSSFMLFQKRIHRPGQRAQFPTGKVSDDVFGAVRHQQTDRVAFYNSL